MINSSFNQDFNFSKNQFDVKELNALMNDKKKKIEKEITKYDVDKDTQAKAQNVQHLAQMPKYLPLFTKKIKDPKAMKKQRANKDIDYTKIKQPRQQSPSNFNIVTETPFQIHEIPSQEQVPHIENFQVISQQEINMNQYEERKMSIHTPNHEIQQEKAGNSSPRKSKSPQKYDPRNHSKYMEEQASKVNLMDRENYFLKQELEQKKQEYEKISFKYAKAQSKFIEIMRELSRFRDEFNDQYSIRSKLLKIQQVTQQIETVVTLKEQMLSTEQQTLQKFKKMEEKLFESETPQSKLSTLNKRRSSMIQKQQSQITTGGDLYNQFCLIKDQTTTKYMTINNIRCLVKYEINKQKALCNVQIFPQTSHQIFNHVFTKITEKFNPLSAIRQLQFKTAGGQLVLEQVEKEMETWIDKVEDEFYYQVNNTMIKYVHGAPFRLLTLGIYPNEAKQQVSFTIIEKDFNKAQCTVDVSEQKLYRDLLPSHIPNASFEDEIMNLINRKTTIENYFSKYIKKNLQIGDQDSSPLSPLSGSAYLRSKSPKPLSNTIGRLCMFDREVKGIKIRRKSFVGGRVSNQTIGGVGGQTTMMGAKPDRRISNVGQTLKNTTMIQTVLEKMKDAVMNIINKKKEQEKNQLNSQLDQMKTGVSRKSPISPKSQKLSSKSPLPEENKMGQIMKLIYANSMYVTIHFELYIIDKDDFPVYLELVHNTDDDSIILFVVSDPKEIIVREVRFDKLEMAEWDMIKQRFGQSAEQLILNIETIFRTLEFLQIVKTILSKDSSKNIELSVPFGAKKKSTEPKESFLSKEVTVGKMTIKIN